MKQFWIVLIAITTLASCGKGDEAPRPVPVIKFVSVSPATVTQYADSLTFTIEYTDGDGDLGSNDPDVKNLFLTDSRNGVQYEFRVKQLAPNNSNIAITGNLTVVLDQVGIIGMGAAETATYSIYVTDRAGNVSNTVITSEVTIQP